MVNPELALTLRRTLETWGEEGREPGGAVCVVRGGAVVAEAWAGTTGAGGPWAPDTLVMGYSVSKPLAALAVLSVIAEGRLTLDQRVAEVWPAYGVHGKETTTVRQVLSHQAGLPRFPPSAGGLGFDDREGLQYCLARATPDHPPGAAVAEHALTYGHLCDALVRRSVGEGVDQRFARLARRHGWDVHLSLGADDLGRVANVVPLDETWPGAYLEDRRWGPALGTPPGLLDPALINAEHWRRTPFAAINVHASARGIATFYADLADPAGAVAHELGQALRVEMISAQSAGRDDRQCPGVARRLAWRAVGHDRGSVVSGRRARTRRSDCCSENGCVGPSSRDKCNGADARGW